MKLDLSLAFQRRACVLAALALLPVLSSSATAQTTTATLVGSIRDDSGAMVPAATITVTNLGTNRSFKTESNDSGNYAVPLLPPGEYSISATKPGFRTEVQRGIILQVEQRATVDLTLHAGAVTEIIEVTATAPLLDAGSSAIGQVIENKRIVELPLNARSVFQLVALSPGVFPNPDAFGSIQADSSIRPSSFRSNGGRSLQNEILIDGIPNNGGSFGQIALHPTVDAVQEYKVQTNNYPAEFGNSGGAIINVSIKSGTNDFHGALWEFLRNDILDANNFFANRAGAKKGQFRFNQYGGTVGGPVLLPKLYNGKDRTFFFFSYEGTKRITGRNPDVLTLPTIAQREGDFSNLRDTAGNLIPIYDPATLTTNAQGQFVRSQFPGNRIPANRINSTSRNLMALYPAPNNVPSNPFTQANNFISLEPNRLDIGQFNLKGDHYFTQSNNFVVRYGRNRSSAANPDFFNNVATPNFGPLVFVAQNAMAQDIHTFGPTSILTVRAGMSRFTTDREHFGGAVDLQEFGFPSYVPSVTFPTVSVSGYSQLGANPGNFIRRGVNIYSLQASLNKIIGNHDLKFGGEWRVQHQNTYQPQGVSGVYTFGRTFTTGPTIGLGNTGDGFAEMLLGTLQSATLTTDAAIAESRPYYALYVQDNWRLTPRFTLNLGLRYDLHSPRTDRFDRLLNFDETTINPVTNTPGVFFIQGRTREPRGQFDRDWNNFAPRLGFSYQVLPSTVIRGGFGVMYISGFNEGDTLPGLALSPTFAIRGLNAQTSTTTPELSISNPFPNGLVLPLAESPGLGLLTGENGTFVDRYYPISYMYNWNFGIQHQLGRSFVLEASYVAAKGNKIGGPAFNLNTLRPEYLALGDALRERVPNPFLGKITSGPLSTATLERQLLLRSFPHFTGVTRQSVHDYFSTYHSFQLRAEKRFSAGLTLLVSYTASKSMDNAAGSNESGASFQNVYDRRLERSLSSEDYPQRFVASYIYELPFGPGKPFAASGVLSRVVGGWQIGGITTFQSERPLAITATGGAFIPGTRRPDVIGNPTLPSNERSISRWFNTSAFAFPATAYTLGNAPRTLPSTRRDGLRNWDLTVSKNTQVREQVSLQFRLEMFNAFNMVNFLAPGQQFGSASFGQISAARDARQIQLGLKLIY